MNWKTIFKSLKNRDMQKRLLTVLGVIVVYRFLTVIPIPLAEPTQLKEVVQSVLGGSDFGGFISLLSGGALASFSIILVGLTPFITVSIVSQLLTKAIPRLNELHKDGEAGRRKINQWTRIATIPVAIIQSIGFIFILRSTILAGNSTILADPTPLEWVVAVTAMTAGAVFLMWLGELATEQGVGQGISLLILAGVVSQLPTILGQLFNGFFDTTNGGLNVFGWFTIPVNPTVFVVTISLSIASLLLLYLLVKINEAQRIITVNYAKRVQGNSDYSGVKSVLPIKLIAAGVIPVIFAVSFLTLPALIGQGLQASGNPEYATLAANLIAWFQAPTPGAFTGSVAESFIYPAAYFILVILFTYFYTGIVFNAHDIAEDLQNRGGFIEGIRPGMSTEKYLTRTVNRLVLFGSIVLGLIAITPFVAEYLLFQLAGISIQNLSIGGTGLLIVVSVGLESLRQINSRALMVTYDDYK
jgi:preprotein translocase subunit SecY